jgi:hypothetical protein
MIEDRTTIVLISGLTSASSSTPNELRYVRLTDSARGTVPAMVGEIALASFFAVDDVVGIAAALSFFKDATHITTRTIAATAFNKADAMSEELRVTLEQTALTTLSKSEIEALGVMSKAVFHRLAGDL